MQALVADAIYDRPSGHQLRQQQVLRLLGRIQGGVRRERGAVRGARSVPHHALQHGQGPQVSMFWTGEQHSQGSDR